jgi:hypothetical protein
VGVKTLARQSILDRFGVPPAESKPKIGRCNPIPETMSYVRGLGHKKLYVYRIPASRFWQTRCYMGGKLVTRSTGTEDPIQAERFARRFHRELLEKQERHAPLTAGSRFSTVALDMLREDLAKVRQGRMTKRAYSEEEQAVNRDLLPFFQNVRLVHINRRKIEQYAAHLNEKRGTPLSQSSLKTYLGFLSKILKHAYDNEWLDRLPVIPKIEREDRPREWFTDEQFALLQKTIRGEIAKGTKIQYQPITYELLELTNFMIEAYLRPSDLRELKNKHVELRESDSGKKYLRINLVKSKTKLTPIVTETAAIETWERIKAVHPWESAPEDYVFLPHLEGRTHAMRILQMQFRHVLKVANLKTSTTGAQRSLYSLRHTCISQALLRGVKPDWLESNTRTSTDMIRRFYASHLTPEMGAERNLK